MSKYERKATEYGTLLAILALPGAILVLLGGLHYSSVLLGIGLGMLCAGFPVGIVAFILSVLWAISDRKG